MLALCLFIQPGWAQDTPPQSAWARVGPSGRLWSLADPQGNRIPDFSSVGYQGGLQEPPEIPVRLTVAPGPGDDTARIQAAIDQLQRLPLGPDDFRGAVYLQPGEFEISNQLTITASGVVLRGAGVGPTGTVLRATGPRPRTLILVTGSGSPQPLEDPRRVTDAYVPVGSRSLALEHTIGLSVGDRVLIRRIATDPWIREIGMDLLCCPPEVNPWTPSGYHIDMDRRIVAIEGSTVILDAPVACAFEQRHAGGTLRRYNWPGRIQHVGIEDLEGVSDFSGPEDEDHAWTFIHWQAVENAWVRRVMARHFGFAAVSLGRGARHVTVAHCASLDPVSRITGGRRYAFVMDDCELCLVQDCVTRQDRHQFVTQSLTTGPNVFVDGRSENALSDAGPHHRWATAALWDNIRVEGHDLNVQNRGNLGSGHGWAGANCVVWNSSARAFVVQNPPGARNWLIGSIGTLRSGTVYVGPHDPGTYDRHGSNVFPHSLYYAQLQNRLAAPGLQVREYWVGQRDLFGAGSTSPETVWVDPDWLQVMQAQVGRLPTAAFNRIEPAQCIVFSFRFTAAPDRSVVAAAIQLCLKSASTNAPAPRIYVDRADREIPWTAFLPGPEETAGLRVYLLDLNGALHTLADGQLNVAVEGDWGVDWALLEVHLSGPTRASTLRLLPEADGHVRDGAFSSEHYGNEPVLAVQLDRTPGHNRRAFLRWNLAEVPPGLRTQLLHVAVQVTPVTVRIPVEHALLPVHSETWPKSALTWQTQPATGLRLATWCPQAGLPVQIGVTPRALAAATRPTALAFQISALQDVGPAGYTDYAASEHPDFARRPQLLLTVPPESVPRPRFRDIRRENDRLRVQGDKHVPRALYRLLHSPDLHTPLSRWTAIFTNVFDAAPTFELTLPLSRSNYAGFYVLELL